MKEDAFIFSKCKKCKNVHAHMGTSKLSKRTRWIYDCNKGFSPSKYCSYIFDHDYHKKPYNNLRDTSKSLCTNDHETRNRTTKNERKQIKMKVDLEKLGAVKTEKGFENKKLSLKNEDLGKKGAILPAVIIDAVQGEFGGDEKIVLTLTIPDLEKDGEGRILPLNKTNQNACLDLFGTELEDWKNQLIELRVEGTMYKGEPTNCIRVYAGKK